jgi:hypothetical protein
VLWPKVGLRGPTCQDGWSARVTGWPKFMAAPTSAIGYPVHRPSLTHWQSKIWKVANTWPTSQRGGVGWPHFVSVGPGFYATSSPHVIFSMTIPYFGHTEGMHRFWSIWCFPVIWCSWNGTSTKLVELISNKHLSSISWMKCRYVGGKYMHFVTANTSSLWAASKILSTVVHIILLMSIIGGRVINSSSSCWTTADNILN